MRYDLSNPLQAQQAITRLGNLLLKGVTIELTEKKARSLQQNAYLHVCLAWIALRLGETMDYVKEYYYKRKCSPDLFIRSRFDDILGYEVEYLRSSRTLSSEEMTLSIERFRDFAAQTLGEYIPSPEEHVFLQQMETEIERNKKYLIGNEILP